MLNLLKSETQEAMVKLIATQADLITLYKEAQRDQNEIIDTLKRLVEIQEQQIDTLKEDLNIKNLRLESYSESIAHYKEKISKLENKQ